MISSFRNTVFVTLTSVGVLGIGAMIWHAARGTSREARADDTNLHDVMISNDRQFTAPSPKRPLPLASIPWKRDSDVFAPAALSAAQLPWQRSADSYEPVFLSISQLPWRH